MVDRAVADELLEFCAVFPGHIDGMLLPWHQSIGELQGDRSYFLKLTVDESLDWFQTGKMTMIKSALKLLWDFMTDDDNSGTLELNEDEIRKQLSWLVDVPLFIDETRVDQLYDITVQPVFYEYQRDRKEELYRFLSGETDEYGGEVEGSLKSSSMFSMIAEGGLAARLTGSHSETEEEEEEIRYQLTSTTQRQLAQIAIQYYYEDNRQNTETASRNYYYVDQSGSDILNATNKYGTENDGGTTAENDDDTAGEWRTPSGPTEPRHLVVLQLPSRKEVSENDQLVPTQLVPTAAEFEDGTVEELYQNFGGSYENPPRYPERKKIWENMGEYYENIDEDETLGRKELSGEIGDDIQDARNYYWKWFKQQFRGKRGIQIIEEAAEQHGDIRWIDFRLPLDDSGETLHLHIQGRGEYNTGTFAYNLVKRGYKHGLLLVGTIKSEPDMDVLAVYER